METMICTCCGAKLVPTTLTAFLTCEYCDNSVTNPYYDAAAAAEAEKPDLAAICLSTLKEMGTAQKLASLDRDCFGDPIDGIDTARAGLSIPDDQQVYFLYSHTFLLIAFSDGLALTDQGLYYSCDSGSGSLSWEAFVTGAISCVDEADGQEGTLRIGSSIELAVKGDKDSRLARFLVDYHNRVYHQYTGETAPASWAVTEPAVSAAAASAEADSPSLLGSVLPGIGALLGSSVLGRQTINASRTSSAADIARRALSMHATTRPTVRQDRNNHIEPPRPLHSHPHHRPAAVKPGLNTRRGPAPMPNASRTDAVRPDGNTKRSPSLVPGANRTDAARPDGNTKRSPSLVPGANRPGGISRPGGTSRPGGVSRPGGTSRPGGSSRPGGTSRSGGSGKGRR